MTDQEKRDKVIKGLEIERECVSRSCGCNRDCSKCDLVQDRGWLLSVYDDAIALLKAQEPRVMTLEEVKACRGNDTIYLTQRSPDGFEGYAFPRLTQSGILWGFDVKWHGFIARVASTYGREYICWTSCPTDAQREATPWEHEK